MQLSLSTMSKKTLEIDENQLNILYIKGTLKIQVYELKISFTKIRQGPFYIPRGVYEKEKRCSVLEK